MAGTSLFYGGGFGQLAAQLIDVSVVIVYGFGLSYAFFKVLDMVIGLRVKSDHEILGLTFLRWEPWHTPISSWYLTFISPAV